LQQRIDQWFYLVGALMDLWAEPMADDGDQYHGMWISMFAAEGRPDIAQADEGVHIPEEWIEPLFLAVFALLGHLPIEVTSNRELEPFPTFMEEDGVFRVYVRFRRFTERPPIATPTYNIGDTEPTWDLE
jgi:hypothetical protein